VTLLDASEPPPSISSGENIVGTDGLYLRCAGDMDRWTKSCGEVLEYPLGDSFRGEMLLGLGVLWSEPLLPNITPLVFKVPILAPSSRTKSALLILSITLPAGSLLPGSTGERRRGDIEIGDTRFIILLGLGERLKWRTGTSRLAIDGFIVAGRDVLLAGTERPPPPPAVIN